MAKKQVREEQNSSARKLSRNLGKPIGKFEYVDKSTGLKKEKKLYSPKRRTERYLLDLTSGKKIDAKGNAVPLSQSDRDFRSGYMLAKMDENALYKFKKSNKHRS